MKAIDDLGHIIGSVRASVDGDTVLIDRLVVDPNLRGNGIGTKLLEAVENLMPDKRYEFFVSDIISGNIDFYKKRGYKEFKAEFIKPDIRGIYFEKVPSK